PAIAAISNLLIPGLGYLYLGRVVSAVTIPAVLFLVLITAGNLGLMTVLKGFYTAFAFLFSVFLFAIVHAAIKARSEQAYVVQKVNRWYWYLAFIVVVLICNSLFAAYRGQVAGYETYSMPSSSMLPTLKPGDFILVDTRYYGESAPNVGDIIVFTPPHSASPFVKRVVAAGEDTVELKGNVLFLNSEEVDEPYIRLSDSNTRLKNLSLTTVPKGYIFVMGDNRNNSADSRVWGAVPVERVIGRVTDIWMSSDSSRIGKVH
ncbi:MAG: signal peptidase I, partial [Porticoccaceae bacterium]|nr:signal peptidase I [Porticoccaceae bacterium]